MKRNLLSYFKPKNKEVIEIESVEISDSDESHRGASEDASGSTIDPSVEQINADCEQRKKRVRDENESSIPDCWTDEQASQFKDKYAWLKISKGKIGCDICARVQTLGSGAETLRGCSKTLSVEWATSNVGPYGDTKSKQQLSLRKKIHDHRYSKAHEAAVKMLQEKNNNVLPQLVAQQYNEHIQTTVRVFRTAYHVAKNNRPFTDHPQLIDLQEANGCDLGKILQSNVVCTDIVTHISSEMRKRLIQNIVTLKPKVSIQVDESTSVSKKTTLILYVRAIMVAMAGESSEDCQPTTFFLDLVELESTTAQGIYDSILATLSKHGLSKSLLSEILIGFGSDGAAVMLGSKSGVATILRKEFPNLISWHCLNHRLELAVSDTVKDLTEIFHFQSFVDSLYTLYSRCPKNLRELQKCSAELHDIVLSIGRVLDTRWVASSFRTVYAIWRSYPVLFKHFQEQVQCKGKESTKFYSLSRQLQSEEFLMNLALMCDALSELRDLSLALQDRNIHLVKAQRLLVRQVHVFESRIDNVTGMFSNEASESISTGHFKGVELIKNSKVKTIRRGQFYASLKSNIENRCLSSEDKKFYEVVKVIYKDFWPDVLPMEFGEKELKTLCDRFQINFGKTKMAFRDFKHNGGKSVPSDLLPLLHCIQTVPVSNAECERGFSVMNIIATKIRSSLSIPHLAELMMISICGPPLHLWNPVPYVKSWLAKGRRSALQDVCLTRRRKEDSSSFQHLWRLL
ncbi:E3 SUMO-protein ligase KIAA1586-like [Pseudophryne corroboree]|uniref:E3 SUMO-protein ligase KIAA1586-like n=1 Tax=Pseudophryne corroboree TaxID=495146 RepID=UPI0030815F98